MGWYSTAKIASNPMPKRKLGRTGWDVGVLSLGGQGSLETQKGNPAIVQRAYELGVNYFDTSPIYGPSEDIYGEVLPTFRKQVFLATKTEKRDRDGALKDIEKSLKRLKTDWIDLWQIHHLENMDEMDEVTDKDGVLGAMVEMKEEGVVRNIGITGHADPKVLTEMMKRFDFDTVLCPVNPCDIHMTPSFIKTVVTDASEDELGVIGMKVFAQGFIFDPEGITTSWELISYALSTPVSTIIVGCDSVQQLEENVAVAKVFQDLSDDQKSDIERKAKMILKRGCFFRKEHGGYGSREKLDPPVWINSKSYRAPIR